MTKWVYGFGDGAAEGRADMKNLLGGKGAGLAEMSDLGLPVPPGFTITTEVCTYYYSNGKSYPSELRDQVAAGIAPQVEHPPARARRPPQDALGRLDVAVGAGRVLRSGHDGQVER